MATTTTPPTPTLRIYCMNMITGEIRTATVEPECPLEHVLHCILPRVVVFKPRELTMYRAQNTETGAWLPRQGDAMDLFLHNKTSPALRAMVKTKPLQYDLPINHPENLGEDVALREGNGEQLIHVVYTLPPRCFLLRFWDEFEARDTGYVRRKFPNKLY